LRHFGRTKYDVPVTRKPQVVDPEFKLALLKKVACGLERDDGQQSEPCLGLGVTQEAPYGKSG
jgi:hypothetical protein